MSAFYEADPHGPNREYVHMLMAVVSIDAPDPLPLLNEAGDGVVAYSVPVLRDKGNCSDFVPSVSGHDYIVASWGSGSFHTYNLAEKVWMALGLTPRCVGNDEQRLIYDDLRLPEFGVVDGEVSGEYYWWTTLPAREAGMLDRILNWAYLAETQSSYDIEREQPPADKAEAFMHALRQAHEARDLDEAYLTELQNLIVTNPMSREAGFRNSQNWLARGGQGALAVRYVPPAPDDLHVTMGEFLLAANVRQPQLPLLQAALNSFGFVYLHPFMDGNGRISRFLFHHALCRAGKLSNGLILPTSAAMKHEELGYLAALETFSRPVRALWNVRWISGSDYELTPRCRPAVYRYWDATAQCEFGARMAAMAVDVHLIKERDFLASFDRAFTRLDDALDMPSALLHRLILMCQENAGVMSKNRRKQYQDPLPAHYFDTIEREVRDAFGLAEPGQAMEKSSEVRRSREI